MKEGERDSSRKKGRIRILVVDDHPVVRSGLRALLDLPDLQVVGEAASGREAVRQCSTLHPDVVLLDLRIPDMDGFQVLGAIRGTWPETAVIVFSQYEDPDSICRAIEAGARSYLAKGTAPEKVVKAVRDAARSPRTPDPGILSGLAEDLRQVASGERLTEASAVLADLTPREREILRCIGKGMKNREISSNLGVSVQTVKTHIYHLYDKLGVRDRTQAALIASKLAHRRDGLDS